MNIRTFVLSTVAALLLLTYTPGLKAGITDSTPQAINFQAIARDAAGNVMSNEKVRLKVEIVDRVLSQVVYVEEHEAGSNKVGLFNLKIGEGEVIEGSFEKLDWSAGDLWLRLHLAIGQGELRMVSETQFVSVPYALHAKTADRLAGTNRALADSVWLLGGNVGISSNLNYIGTSDFEDVVLKTDGTERLRMKAQGQIGIGTISPATSLEIFGDMRVGDGSNYGQIDADGDLFFKGAGDYLVGPNRYAFRYQFQEDYGLRFNALDFRYEFLTAGMARVFSVGANNGEAYVAGKLGVGTTTPTTKLDVNGTATIGTAGSNYASFGADGDLTFVGNGDYLVGGDRYAFRYLANQNFGMFFSSTTGSYQLMDATASPVFSVRAANGETHVAGNLGIGTTLPSTKLDVAGTITATGFTLPVNATAGHVLTTDAFGVASWQPGGGGGGSDNDWIINGNDMYSGVSERVGIGTSAPLSKLHVSDTSGVLFEGQFGTGTIPIEGPGTRLMWYPGKAAFRAGRSAATEWDDVNIGFSSVAYGFATEASGNNAVAMGSVTMASGSNSTAMGNFSIASGSAATAMGWNSTASGEFATVMGQGTLASGKNSLAIGAASHSEALNSAAFGLNTTANGTNATALGSFTTSFGNSALAIGHNTHARSYASLVLGQYNILAGDSGMWLASDPVFVIGNGASTVSRSNAVTVLKNGNFGIGQTTPLELLDVNGGVRFGNTTATNAGTIRFNGSDLEGFVGGAWISLTGGGGSPGDPDQTLNLSGTNLNISGGGGNTINLISLVDDADADPSNEIQELIQTGNNLALTSGSNIVDLSAYLDNSDAQTLLLAGNDLSISNGNSVDLTALVNDNDADPTNEIQNISLTGTTLGLSGSTPGSINLSAFLDNTDAQSLSLAGNNLNISGGNSVNLSTLINDADADPSNEIQDLSFSGTNLALSNSVVSVNLSSLVDDADADPSNEIQDLSLNANNLGLSGSGPTVSLAGYLDNTDNQNLSLSGNNLSIGGGNSVNLSGFINDADSNPINELQDLTLSGTTLSLTGSTPTIDLSPLLDNTDNQSLNLSGNTLSISGSVPTVNLAGYLDNTDNQSISLTGNTLSISGSGPTVDLTAFLDNSDAQTLSVSGSSITISNGNSVAIPTSSSWTTSGNNIYNSNSGNVGIGTTNPIYSLDVNGGFQVSQLAVFQSLSIFSGNANFTANVGIGTISPSEKLHVVGNARINGNLCYSGSFGACSDVRYKEDFLPIGNALSRLLSIEGLYYDWKQTQFPEMHFPDERQIGVIAQEVEKAFPELVMDDEDGFKSVDYSKFSPVLIEAIREQQAMINALQRENAEMKVRLDKVEQVTNFSSR